ncbi:hypothetical protein JDV02_001748 [Purpureocillium takamizusanense]|uniref:Acetate kinase n=1 Tax=Purpureocillium takamizusanense TaxID=2060973 RepID=A0A9Q8Q8Z5_9HYPO|nr:uncharacterized protein JDV02_001748 [Purpureocillium takamizusanense]UNI15190.1 hypothetical protein JDV02_001748 [Purpureocillium takamizusanense]
MAATSSSSGSSFTSSSLGRPPTYSRSYVSPVDSTWTPTSGISTISAPSTGGSAAPQTSLRHLDLGPPGYQATITLFQDTPDERTVYLGPWEVVGSEQRRVLWQCSYQNELLEHYLPSDIPSEIHPHTLHSRHRQYHDPSDMERYLTFPEPHRIRYTTDEGVCIHDQYINVRYEFTSVEGSIQFQGDVRRRDMINYFDIDVAWTNVHGRTDGFGKVKGIGAIQRLKMWRDRYTTFHSISVLANKTDGQYREYDVHLFEGELRGRDDRAKQVRLNVRSRRGSAPDDNNPQRRFSFAQRVRPRMRSTGHAGHSPQDSPGPSQASVDIRYLSIQFSSRSDYRRFLEAWAYAHTSDRDFQGLPFPPNHFELPSPQMLPGLASELPSPSSPELSRSLDPVLEPDDQDPRG